MKLNKAEIQDVITSIWVVYAPDIENIKILSKDSFSVTFVQMYDYVDLQLKHLVALAKHYDTSNINDDDRYHQDGCETCDYGSSYEFTLTIRDIGKGI